MTTFTKLTDEEKKIAGIQEAAGYCAFEFWRRNGLNIKKWKSKGVISAELKKALDGKRDANKVIVKKYIDILNYGGEWGIAGLYKAAEAQLAYVNAIRNIDENVIIKAFPKELRSNEDRLHEAVDYFRSELENKVFPVEEGQSLRSRKPHRRRLSLGFTLSTP